MKMFKNSCSCPVILNLSGSLPLKTKQCQLINPVTGCRCAVLNSSTKEFIFPSQIVPFDYQRTMYCRHKMCFFPYSINCLHTSQNYPVVLWGVLSPGLELFFCRNVSLEHFALMFSYQNDHRRKQCQFLQKAISP